MAVDDTNAYFGGADRRVVVLDLASGRTRWSRRLSGPINGGVLFDGKTLYLATDRPEGKVWALNPASGNERWVVSTGYVRAPLALVDGTLVVLARTGDAFGIEARTGEVRWRAHLPSMHLGATVLSGGEVLVTSHDSLYRVRARDGVVMRRARSPAAITTPWQAVESLLVAATGDSLIVAIRPDSLDRRWAVRLDGPVAVPPAISGDTIHAVTQAGTLYQVLASGSPEAVPLGGSGSPPTGGVARYRAWVLVGGSDGILRAFDPDDGAASWQVMVGRPLELAPVTLRDGSLLVLSAHGDVQRIR